jgi:hypothetical protein
VIRDQDDLQALAYARDDLNFFAGHCLKVKPKVGGALVPLRLNRAQMYVHAKLEEQKRAIGRVRALILKGRQQGISTYIAARYYHRTAMHRGISAWIMAHEQKASDTLFGLVERYHDHNPLRPSISAANAKELKFGRLDSGYQVATAGTQDTGRSATAQLFHASEFAFWQNAPAHMAGIGNIVADQDGTEIVIESTGNGIGNPFHSMWQDAVAGKGEFIAIFVPWCWQDEYRTEPRADLAESMSKEDLEYQEAHGLDLAQMQWRHNKIVSYGAGFEWLFDQEYPAVPELAFQSPTANPLISPSLVARAQKNAFRDRYGSLIIGCDPSEGVGKDRTAIAFRHGRVCWRVEAHDNKSPMEVVGLLVGLWSEFQPDAMMVDKIGIGAGIVDRLHELNVPVIGVNSAQEPSDKSTYANLRAEMWWKMEQWLNDFPVRLPPSMALAADLSAPGVRQTSNGLKLLEKKEDMLKRGIRSPDLGDALALTFAYDVPPMSAADRERRINERSTGHQPASRAGY